MTWVPTRGQRERIRSRFAELTRAFQPMPIPPATAPGRQTLAKHRATNSAPVSRVNLPNPSNPEPVTNSEFVRQKGKNDNDLDPQDAKIRSGKDQLEWNIHHVPPKHPRRYILKRVRKKHHDAYHLLFGSSPSFEACVRILKEHWWSDSSRLDR
jgi:hypothetical protein